MGVSFFEVPSLAQPLLQPQLNMILTYFDPLVGLCSQTVFFWYCLQDGECKVFPNYVEIVLWLHFSFLKGEDKINYLNKSQYSASLIF